MKDGRVIAFPQGVSETIYTFQTKLASEMGITQPRTWDELLDLVERWDADFAHEYPEKALYRPFDMERMKKTLLTNILIDYETLLNRPGQEQKFDTPALRHLLERLDRIDYAPFDAEKQFSEGYSVGNDDLLILQGGSILPSVEDRGQPLFLGMDSETEPALKVNMSVYVVNPYSKNQDLAIDYLEACVETMPEERQMTYFADWSRPIENPYFQTEVAEYDRRIEEYTQALNNASEEEKQSIQQQLDKEKAARQAYIDERQYAYTEEQVSQYHERAKSIVVMRNTYIDDVYALVERYVDDQMGADQLLQELDQKLRMMRAENEY